MAADSHNFDKEQDPDPDQSDMSDPDPHQCEKRDPDPELHLGDADPQHCSQLGKIGENLLHARSLGARNPWQRRLTKKNNESQHLKAVDPWGGRGCSQLRQGGSKWSHGAVNQRSQIRITFMKKRIQIRIRIKVISMIRIRINVKRGIRNSI